MNVHIAEEANLAFVERRIGNFFSPTEERNGDRDGTGATETDDRDTQEGVESSGRAKVDAREGALHGRVEEEGVQRHFKTLGHAAPELVTGNTAITRETARQLKALLWR